MTDLADRNNPSAWSDLLDAALPALDHVFGGDEPNRTVPDWTIGGGTAIALRIAHRISDDVDLFVLGAPLRSFTPHHNPVAAKISKNMEWPGHYLKYIRQDGEIDFLHGSFLTSPGYTWETFRGRPVAVETAEEVIVKKIRYRASSFKARDAFDLAAVSRNSESLLEALVIETGDALPRLLTAINRLNATSLNQAKLRPLPGFEGLKETAVSDARLIVEKAITALSAG